MQSRAARVILAFLVAVAVFIAVNAGITVFMAYSPKDTEQIPLEGEAQSQKLSGEKFSFA